MSRRKQEQQSDTVASTHRQRQSRGSTVSSTHPRSRAAAQIHTQDHCDRIAMAASLLLVRSPRLLEAVCALGGISVPLCCRRGRQEQWPGGSNELSWHIVLHRCVLSDLSAPPIHTADCSAAHALGWLTLTPARLVLRIDPRQRASLSNDFRCDW